MGFREGVLLGIVLFLSCGDLFAAAQNVFNISNNENQIPQEHATTSLPQTTEQHTNQTTQRHQVHSPVTYRLRSYQLKNAALSRKTTVQPLVEQTQTFQSTDLTPGQLESTETDLAQDLDSPVKQESKVVVKFERRVPVPADSVAAHCGEGEVTIQVKQNFLGNSQLINPGDLTLGGCATSSITDQVLQFQAGLQDCGSAMTMTKDALIYTFSLKYSPTPIGNTFILKTNPAEVIIECHYQRRRNVSSNTMRPTWKPFASDMLAEQQLHFSLRLMTEDWQSQRPSSVYFLSDMMHIEASVLQGHHVPLRVHMDSCVATVNPDPSSQLRYVFIKNHGCLTDAKLTGAKSFFMQRSHEDKLHLQLKAFRFHQDPKNSFFITCLLKATTVSVPINSQNKACSFLTEANRWVASDGDNKVCSCCETSCSEQRRRRSLGPDAVELPQDLKWEEMAALGPILLKENIPLSKLPPEPVSLLQTHVVTQATLLCGVGGLAAVMIVLVCAIIHTRAYKPSGHTVCT
ncbi:zona pellucida sperm-binding protein 3-like [Anabas testudineus]|uniref:zona pellucida sperm-binding protein 3-like n=1 Tax=Anabas testudineus TaxID=64144 RepID=UPI000E45ED02|nr:zona pellucida sperm-binding protein 3-like [Anabas testudineus]